MELNFARRAVLKPDIFLVTFSRKAAGISHRTIQNERAVMRAILEKDGRLKIADPSNPLLSNEALGLKDTCRDGKKIAVSPDEFWKAFAKVEKRILVWQLQCSFLMFWV